MPAENIACVKCTSVLDKSMIADVEVDLCPKCGGLWLDRGEITRLAAMPDSELVELREHLCGSAGPPPIPSETTQHCPACSSTLKEVVLGPVRVDYCEQCHGIFLDRGELDAAVESVRKKGAGAKQVLAVAAKATTASAGK
ncbi:MAG TPA: zf-TFIIB domain-containing protein [Polyangia bacterium]|nr:zf-TFIIB domain-containing protein [Polyangia bacterium]